MFDYKFTEAKFHSISVEVISQYKIEQIVNKII